MPLSPRLTDAATRIGADRRGAALSLWALGGAAILTLSFAAAEHARSEALKRRHDPVGVAHPS
jgi:hypothetical protein